MFSIRLFLHIKAFNFHLFYVLNNIFSKKLNELYQKSTVECTINPVPRVVLDIQIRERI